MFLMSVLKTCYTISRSNNKIVTTWSHGNLIVSLFYVCLQKAEPICPSRGKEGPDSEVNICQDYMGCIFDGYEKMAMYSTKHLHVQCMP